LSSIARSELTIPAGSVEITYRADWSFRDDLFGEPSSDPARFTFIESRDLVNADISYQPADGDWAVGIYGGTGCVQHWLPYCFGF
jgi:iron complex outermembrane receptor protein